MIVPWPNETTLAINRRQPRSDQPNALVTRESG